MNWKCCLNGRPTTSRYCFIEVGSIMPWCVCVRARACRYLNDSDYYGGFEQRDLDQLFDDMKSNFRAWVSGFGPLAVGADLKNSAVQEFCRTFFQIRPDIALSVTKTIFQSDLRAILPQVSLLLIIFSTVSCNSSP